MSSANRVSYRAFLFRLRSLAKTAIQQYGVEKARLEFMNYSGNGLYRVTIPEGKSDLTVPPGRYALRLHQPDYMKPEFIWSEMEWLSALSESGIEVPHPYRNLDGEWLTIVDGGYEVPQKRTCTLIGWTEGRMLLKNHLPKHFRSLGRVIGKLHRQSMSWKKPKGFKRPHWDWEGLFGDGFDYGVPVKDAWEAIPKKHQDIFNSVLDRVAEVTQQMGKGKRAYGLIHTDLGVDGNVVFHAGEARPFDFDDCGFGYWMFDLGGAMAHYFADIENPSPKMQQVLIGGYQETSPLPESNLDYLDLFIAARYAQLMFFYSGATVRWPQTRDEGMREVNHYASFLKQIVKRL